MTVRHSRPVLMLLASSGLRSQFFTIPGERGHLARKEN
jgi:hypothetical protein